jgi:hypothetical protein
MDHLITLLSQDDQWNELHDIFSEGGCISIPVDL